MSRIETVVQIDQPLDRVFAYLSDLRSMTEWAKGVLEAERVTAEPVGPGTIYRIVALIGGRRLAMSLTVTEYAPGRMYASVSRMGPVIVDDRWEFTPAGSGTCVRQVTVMHAPGLLAPLGPLAARLAGKRIADDLRTAARRLEAPPAAPALRPKTAGSKS